MQPEGDRGTGLGSQEPALQLLNEGWRYRDLETGTFLTRDPLGFVDGPNMYAYVVDNPWTKFDPEGLYEADGKTYKQIEKDLHQMTKKGNEASEKWTSMQAKMQSQGGPANQAEAREFRKAREDAEHWSKETADAHQAMETINEMVGKFNATSSITAKGFKISESARDNVVYGGGQFQALQNYSMAFDVGTMAIAEAAGPLLSKALGSLAQAVGDVGRSFSNKAVVEAGEQATVTELKQALEGGLCFAAGTEIATRNGACAIEQIRIGDEVWATDLENQTSGYYKVVRTFVHETDELQQIETSAGDSITCTTQHPFWVEGKGWTPACELQFGDKLKSKSGEDIYVAKGNSLREHIKVYNFEVEKAHSYYVGTQPVLVHNSSKAESSVWQNLQSWRGKIKTDGEKRYVWDYTHGDIEVFNKQGQHLGSMDPNTGAMIKPPVPGRSIEK